MRSVRIMVFRAQQRADTGRFRLPVALAELGAGQLCETLAQDPCGHGRGPIGGPFQAGEIRRGGVWVRQQHAPHRRHQAQRIDAIALDALEDGRRVEALLHDQRHGGYRGGDRELCACQMEHGQYA